MQCISIVLNTLTSRKQFRLKSVHQKSPKLTDRLRNSVGSEFQTVSHWRCWVVYMALSACGWLMIANPVDESCRRQPSSGLLPSYNYTISNLVTSEAMARYTERRISKRWVWTGLNTWLCYTIVSVLVSPEANIIGYWVPCLV